MSLLHILTVVTLAKFAVYLTISWVAIFISYRIFLHPLRKYPGPVWAKITNGYGGFHAMTQKPHIHVYQNFERYGSVYREGPNKLLFNSLDAIRDIYLNPELTKSHSYHNIRWASPYGLFDTQDRTYHSHLRKVVGQVTSDRNLRGFEPDLLSQIDVFLRLMLEASRKSEVVDMSTPLKHLVMDVIGHLGFGFPLNTQTDTNYRFMPNSLAASLNIANISYAWPAFSWIIPVLQFAARSKLRKYGTTIRKFMLMRMSMPADAKADFYSIAKGQLSLDAEALEKSELWQEAFFFVTAGTSTVAAAMAGVLFHLAKHDDIYAKAATEIRETFESGHDIRNGVTLAGCKYLRAVIEETHRLTSPALQSMWRTGDPKLNKPLVIDGHVIPSNTEVAVNIWSILHNPKFFPEPFSFRPDRWLSPTDGTSPNPLQTDDVKDIMRQAQVGFGAGERNCPGKSLAYQETSILIAKILWYFDFKFAPGESGKLGTGVEGSPHPWGGPDQFQLRDILAADYDGPNLVFTTRGDYWQEMENTL